MKQVGVIVRQTRKKASVRVKRPAACGENCAQCAGCPTTDQVVVASNPIGAPRGATVILEMPDKMVFLAAFLVYVLPLILFFAGYFLAGQVTDLVPVQILSAFLCLLVFFFLLRKKDAKLLKKGQYGLVITQILHEGAETTEEQE